jgi:hypothetical protein
MANNDWIDGQDALIEDTKIRILQLVDRSKDEDMMFDLVDLLQNLKPLPKSGS